MPSAGRAKVACTLLAASAVLVPVVTVPATAEAASSAPLPKPGPAHVMKAKKLTAWDRRRVIADKALSWARKKKGSPYHYGAAGPNSFDCSGLVGYVYRKAGVKLPRTTGDIYRKVRIKVGWNGLQPGDLVFFYGGRSHVGIVSRISGKRIYMIHAPSSGDHVREVQLDKYRKRYFNGAVRPY